MSVPLQDRLATEETSAPIDRAPERYGEALRAGWRPLAGATLGLSAGMGLNAYLNSTVAPYLLEAFGWSKSEYALLGTLSLLTLLCIPLSGRCADLFGVRRVAAVGVITYPVAAVLLSQMQGDIRWFYAIVVLQIVFCTCTTTVVYCKAVAARFTHGRGLALAIAAGGPAVVGAVGSPLLTAFMDDHGWRAGYLAVASYSAIIGAIALLLLPSDYRSDGRGLNGSLNTSVDGSAAAASPRRSAKADYASIVSSRAFWILLLGALLCSLPHALSYSQVKVMLLEHGLDSAQSAVMVTVFGAGVIIGRFGAGIALDRFPTPIVAAVTMGLPCIGLLILATPTTQLLPLAIAVALLGLSFGGEGDLLAYAAGRYFPMGIYSSVLGLLGASVGVAITLGSTLLSLMLHVTDSYSSFMIGAAICVIIGALNFLRLDRQTAA